MSDCGGILIAALAFPLVLTVLLVAGVAYLALQGARLVGQLAQNGIHLASQGIAATVRAANSAFTTAADGVTAMASATSEWASTLFDSRKTEERLSSRVHSNYKAALSKMTGSMPMAILSAATGISQSAASSVPVKNDDTQRIEARQQIAKAEAVMNTLEDELPLRLVADTWYGDQLRSARDSMQLAASDLLVGKTESARRLADEAEATFATALQGSYRHLVNVERVTVAAQVGNTLEDMGYSVKAASSPDAVALVGRRGHQVVAFVTKSGGKVEMDMAGFSGDSCDAETKQLLENLRKGGLSIGESQIRRHGRFEGGALIRRAQKSGQCLETALLEAVTIPMGVDVVAQETTCAPVRRKSKLQSAADQKQQAKAWVWQRSDTGIGGNA